MLDLACLFHRKVIHNITAYPVTERPGTESYDPVLLGGKSVRSVPPSLSPAPSRDALTGL